MGTGFDDRAGREFPPYIVGGRAEFTPGLQSLVDDWSRYHLIKLAFAALLLALALYLGHRALALFPTVLVIANVQGAVAPLSSAFSLLGDRVTESDGPLAVALGRMRTELRSGQLSAPVDVLVDDFARYHLVVAVMAGVVAVIVLAFAVRDWRAGRRRWAVATLVAAVAAAVVAAANTSNALDPAGGLLGFLGFY